MHNFEVHSNESACRKIGRLGLEQVYKQNCLCIFIVVSFGVFVIIIFIRIWFINCSQDQIFILGGVLDEVY